MSVTLPSDAPVPVAPALVVTRWRRYKHDRAYVKTGSRDLGYRDLISGEVHCPQQSDVAAVTAATEDLYARTCEIARAEQYRPKHAIVVAAVETQSSLLPDRDLALNRPGQAARQRAHELRDAAPVRTFFERVVGSKTDERSWRIGADGEDDVASRLARLGDGWRVLHAVPVGTRGSDIDHVVIGPGGVFTINTKNHPDANVWVRGDTIKVNGHNQPYVRNSRHEAARAGKLLTAAAGTDVLVQAVIAVVGAHRGFTVRSQPADVLVTTRREVAKRLEAAPVVLDAAAIDTIFDAARHLSTWQPDSVAREVLG